MGLRAAFSNGVNMRKAIIIIIFIALFSYGNSLLNTFVCDDNYMILKNDFITSFGNFPSLFDKSYLSTADNIIFDSYHKKIYGSGEITYRPVTTLSYMFDYFFWKLNPFGYHLTNILLHVFNVVLFYLFVLLLLKNDILALFSSLLFAAHPINTAAVNHISNREELLVVFFLLSAFILFIRHKKYQGFKKTALYAGSCLSFLLAIFSKEMAITFPLMIMLYDFYFEFNADIKRVITNLKSRYIGYLAVMIFYLVIYFFVFSPNLRLDRPYTGGCLYTHLITISIILARYITAFFIPLNISITPPYYAPVATTIFNYEVLLSLALLVSVGIVCLKIYRTSKAASFGILWFFVTILPVSNIIPLVNMFTFRYMYLPAIGLCLTLAIACLKFANLKSLKNVFPNVDKILMVLVIGTYMTITIPQNIFWRNNFSFGKNQIMYYPNNPEPYQSLSKYYFERDLLEKSMENLRIYLRYKPNDPLAYNDLGVCYIRLGMDDKAIPELKKAIKLRLTFTDAYYNLGIAYLNKKEFHKAIELFKKAVDLDPEYADAYNNLAVAHTKLDQHERARKFFSKALEVFPDHEIARENLESLEDFFREQIEN